MVVCWARMRGLLCVRRLLAVTVALTSVAVLIYYGPHHLRRQKRTVVRKATVRQSLPYGNKTDGNFLQCAETDTVLSHDQLELGIASQTGEYTMHPHAYRSATPVIANNSVCLATFASVNRLNWLPWLLNSWSGPMSVAVYTPGNDYYALRYIMTYFKECFPAMSQKVAIHVLYPTKQKPSTSAPKYLDTSELDCSDLEGSVTYIIKEMRISNDRFFTKLPQNHLRNLARRSCLTPFSVVADIDMIPSLLMYERLNPLLREKMECKKCALVIPVYEIVSSESHLPATKKSLLKYLDEHIAQRYHIQVYDLNQRNSKLDIWEAANVKNNETEFLVWSLFEDISSNNTKLAGLTNYKEIPYREIHKITSYEEFWEPIMVLPREAPGYDERFVGFGFCRSSLTYELKMRGFSFRLLDEPFLTHWGFQTLTHYPKYRILENKENHIRYEAFKRELKARYSMPPTEMEKITVNRKPQKLYAPHDAIRRRKVSSRLRVIQSTNT